MSRSASVLRSGVACAALAAHAAGQLSFTEEAAARGITGNVITSPEEESFGYGVAFADLDEDGDPDLVQVGRVSGVVGVFRNDGQGVFTSAGTGIPLVPKASGITAADYDADGDLDLYVTCSVGSNRLFRNNGGFSFTDVSVASGLNDPGAGMGAAWADFDGDGWLDVFVPNRTSKLHGGHNRLFRNQGDGTFVDVMTAVGVGYGDDPTFQAVWLDFDRDGDQDLYLSTDKGYIEGTNNHLYENRGGAFQEITHSSGTAANFNSMGVAVGDFDRDSRVDLYATNTPEGNALFLQTSPAVFVDAAAAAGVLSMRIGWGAVMFDADNDGILDLYVCNTLSQNRLYLNDLAFPTSDEAVALGVADPGRSYGVATADIDLDGDVDLAVSNFLDPMRLFVNHVADVPGPANRWVRVQVVGRGTNRHAIGAEVEVEAGPTQVAAVTAGGSYKCQHDLTLSFGVGTNALVPRIRTRWPDGSVRTLRDYPANRTWRVYSSARLGDFDGDGRVGPQDVVVLLGCWTGPGPGSLAEGCETMDLDGDGDVDGVDYQRFILRLDPGVAVPEPPP